MGRFRLVMGSALALAGCGDAASSDLFKTESPAVVDAGEPGSDAKQQVSRPDGHVTGSPDAGADARGPDALPMADGGAEAALDAAAETGYWTTGCSRAQREASDICVMVLPVDNDVVYCPSAAYDWRAHPECHSFAGQPTCPHLCNPPDGTHPCPAVVCDPP